MKKNKWLALILAGILAFGVTACGGGGKETSTDEPAKTPVVEEVEEDVFEDEDYVGDWECVGYVDDNDNYDEDEYGDSSITLYDNYTTEAIIMDAYYEGEWDFTESGVVLYLYMGGYEEEVYCDLVDNLLYMDYMDMYTLLEKVQ